MNKFPEREVYLVDGLRSPFLKFASGRNPFSATELAVQVIRALLLRQAFPISKIDMMITGCVMPSDREANISRIIALRTTGRHDLPAYTVARNCASGLQAIDNAYQAIQLGQANLVIAGGVESMSQAPILASDQYSDWLLNLRRQKTAVQKLKHFIKFKLNFLKPKFGLEQGLSDPTIGLNMGQTAEKLSAQFKIERAAMDDFAWTSHQKAEQAVQAGYFNSEITPLLDSRSGQAYLADDGIRTDTSVAKLNQLKPVFESPFGLVTAGNSSQISDGGAFVVLASKQIVSEYQLPVLAKINLISWAALDPSVMGLGPALVISQILNEANLSISEIDTWEINEAFAGQVLSCVQALQDLDFCQTILHRKKTVGQIPLARLNQDGGAIALGHPVGASGARLPLHLAHILNREQAKYGIASLCVGGGQGGGILLERVN